MDRQADDRDRLRERPAASPLFNNELDDVTDWSASCNGDHYWALLLVGEGDQITLANNWIHDTVLAINDYLQTNEG